MPVAVLRDAAEDCAHLIGGECLEFSGVARYAIDQSGNILAKQPGAVTTSCTIFRSRSLVTLCINNG
jgi:hypothetical protein